MVTAGNLDNGPTGEKPVEEGEDGISLETLLVDVVHDTWECPSPGSQIDEKQTIQEGIDMIDVDEED